MQDLDADRMVLYVDSADDEWITLRIVLFHVTIFQTSITDILSRAGVEMSEALEELLTLIQKMESSPSPVFKKPQALPTIPTILRVVPYRLEIGMSYPQFDGYQLGGLALNPGGTPRYTDIPYAANLCDVTYLGLNFFLQSGMLNGAASLVSQALLHYRRASMPRMIFPLNPVTEYLTAYQVDGATVYYNPSLYVPGKRYVEGILAANSVRYYSGPGLYNINRYFSTACPIPEIPDGHFLRPYPGQYNLKVVSSFDMIGRCDLAFTPVQTEGITDELLDLTPYGCLPGWPSDEFLGDYYLYNDDSLGMYSFSQIVGEGGGNPDQPNPVESYGQVVVAIEEPGELVPGAYPPLFPVLFSFFSQTTALPQGKVSFGLIKEEYKGLLFEGEPLTIAGFLL